MARVYKVDDGETLRWQISGIPSVWSFRGIVRAIHTLQSLAAKYKNVTFVLLEISEETSTTPQLTSAHCCISHFRGMFFHTLH